MKIFAAIFMLLLSSVAFAQQLGDIGRIVFLELLGMRNYPGSPFTGNIINDLIMFLIIPTIFIIFVVFILLGRLAVHQKGIRILLGIGIYLFIVAGGYYGTFALLAGPYFIFLIFILGLLYFIPSHFRVRGGGMPGRGARAEYGEGERPDERRIQNFLRMPVLNPIDRNELEHELSVVNTTLSRLDDLAKSGARIDTAELHRLETLKKNIERKLYGRRLGK